VAEVGNGVDAEGALGTLDEEAVLAKDEDCTEVTEMVRPSGAVNQNIIEKDEDELAEKLEEDVVQQRLKRRRRVAQPERHDEELVEAIMGAERRLVDVRGPHANLMVARAEVELGEVLGVV